jgi:hypothetical protein
VLGRIALTRRADADAEAHFLEAHRTFDAIDARYELARTELDQALLGEARGDPDRAATYRAAAHARLEALGFQRDPRLGDTPLEQRLPELTASRQDARQAGDADTESRPELPQGEKP